MYKETLSFIRRIADELGINGSFYEVISAMKDNKYNISFELEAEIKNFLKLQNIERVKENVYSILHPGVSVESVPYEELVSYSLDMLNGEQTVNYFGLVMYSISFVEYDGLILMKYNACVYNVGWFEFAKLCRGVIVDADTYEVIAHPFDKFFNINECTGYRIEDVAKRLKTAENVSLTDKKDGTLISVVRYIDKVGKNRLIVSTNGGLDNNSQYIDWAKALFAEKYNKFFENVPDGYDFIFELVIPETKVIIDYGDTRKLFLLNIRNLNTGRFLLYDEIKNFADEYGLDITEQYEFKGIKNLISEVHSAKNVGREGYVLKISDDGEDYFVKIKFEEYFVLHKMLSRISERRVYNLLSTHGLESFLAMANDDLKEDVSFILEEININREKYIERVSELGKEFLNKKNLTREQILSDNELLKNVIAEIGPGPIFSYIRGDGYLRNVVEYSTWKKYCKMKDFVKEN